MNLIHLLLLSHSFLVYQVQKGDVELAFSNYRKLCEEEGPNLSLARELGVKLLEEGLASKDPQVQILSLFGAGVAFDEMLSGPIQQTLCSSDGQVQLVALHQIARLGNGSLDRALASDFLLTRLEALHLLADRKDPRTAGQTEAVMRKIPIEIWPPFIEVLAKCRDVHAAALLKQMTLHPDPNIKYAAILAAGLYQREDLLPQLRILATHTNNAQKEACAFALGKMKDSHSLAQLEKLAADPDPSVRQAALISLYHMGKSEAAKALEMESMQENLGAINALAEVEGSKEVLAHLIKSPKHVIRFNAAISLLKQKDPRALPVIEELLLPGSKDMCIMPSASAGKSGQVFRVVPSAQEQFAQNSQFAEIALRMKEQLLLLTLELSQEHFLPLCEKIFDRQAYDLVPTAIRLLENQSSPEAIALLKRGHSRLGAPLVRGWCTLALFRLEEAGPYEAELRAWVKSQMGSPLFAFRPVIAREFDESTDPFELTPNEVSALLVESFQSFASASQDRGIALLVEAIATGHPKNRYPLAGLLVRAAQ